MLGMEELYCFISRENIGSKEKSSWKKKEQNPEEPSSFFFASAHLDIVLFSSIVRAFYSFDNLKWVLENVVLCTVSAFPSLWRDLCLTWFNPGCLGILWRGLSADTKLMVCERAGAAACGLSSQRTAPNPTKGMSLCTRKEWWAAKGQWGTSNTKHKELQRRNTGTDSTLAFLCKAWDRKPRFLVHYT